MRGEAGVHSLKSRALICSHVSDAAAAQAKQNKRAGRLAICLQASKPEWRRRSAGVEDLIDAKRLSSGGS